MCQHQPRCPQSRAPDHLSARTVAAHPEQGWSMLCNGVIVFDDGGELLPDGRAIPRAAPPWPVRWQWPPEVVLTLAMSWAKAQRAIGRQPQRTKPSRTPRHSRLSTQQLSLTD